VLLIGFGSSFHVIVGLDVGALHVERPVDVSQVARGFVFPAAVDELDDLLVLLRRGDFPFLAESALAWEVVQALLADPDGPLRSRGKSYRRCLQIRTVRFSPSLSDMSRKTS